MEPEEADPFEAPKKKVISVAKNTPAVVTVAGTGGDLHDLDPLSDLRIRTAAQAGVDMGRAARVTLMREIGVRFGVPPAGFPTGQSRIYVDGDIRFEQFLRLLSKEMPSKAASANLKRAKQLIDTDILLVLTTTAREYAPALTARGSEVRDSFKFGGLDFLWDSRRHLGLPRAIVDKWEKVEPYESLETYHTVHPALIPVRDQILGYAAQTRLSFANFQAHAKRELGQAEGQGLFDALSKDARIVWQAYSFVGPGGAPFDPKKGPHHGKTFGVNAALGYLRHLASQAGVALELNVILTNPSLHHTDYVKIAKARAMEAAFLERLLDETAASVEATATR